MKFILGTKQHMTQMYDEKGRVHPVTAIKAQGCFVSHIKTEEKDGYSAVQFASGRKNVSKALRGHSKGVGNHAGRKGFAVMRELRGEVAEGVVRGVEVSVSTFVPGDVVDVMGVSKGRGFAGVVKRHGFAGGPASHGHKDQLRMPGSIGSTGPQKVFKGVRMAGRMGGANVTVKGAVVVQVDEKEGLIYVRGGVPGARNGTVALRCEGDLAFVSAQNSVAVEETNSGVSDSEQVPVSEQSSEAVSVESSAPVEPAGEVGAVSAEEDDEKENEAPTAEGVAESLEGVEEEKKQSPEGSETKESPENS